jgi:hypothetical protein
MHTFAQDFWADANARHYYIERNASVVPSPFAKARMSIDHNHGSE